MKMLKLQINGSQQELDMVPDTPLLWAAGDGRHRACTKYGCGIREPGVIAVTPADANVVIAVTGKPVCSLPDRL